MPAIWFPSDENETAVLAQQVSIVTDYPRNAAEVLAVQVSIGVEPTFTPAPIQSVCVMVAVRADHKPNGGKYSIAATPGAEDTQVIYHDLIFPRCFSYGSTGSPKYITDKVEVDSGAEQRNQRRIYPRHEYNIEMEALPANEISEIMNLWHVCAGDHIGFLFMDPMDHTSLNNETTMSGTEVSSSDQLVGSAVGSQSSYELYKYYQAGTHDMRRRIRYPDRDTLLVEVNGYAINSWEYSYDTCTLDFKKPLGGGLTANLTVTAGVISGADFSALAPGDLIYMSGWASFTLNASPGGDPFRVVEATEISLVLQRFNGSAYSGTVTTPTAVTITSALPPTGAEIRAGFYFFTPVRFDDGDNMESEIRAGLRESASADFPRISLREIFE